MSEFLTVSIAQGELTGRLVASKSGGTFCSFQGVPYAKPPVGPLRFKTAEPPEPWSGVRDALTEGNNCSQYNYYVKEYVGEEDCLVLNVYSPQLPEGGTAPSPVMVWFHGGGFVAGSGDTDLFGPDFLVDEGVVLVTVNYRLGVLGFLCTDDASAPGNVGLKDQVAALRWVQKNITSFGGDPNNVTIFGESAGGSSVHFHMISPMSQGLFHRAIAMSGAAFNSWTWESHPRDMAFRLGAVLGCTTKDPQQLVDFLRTVDHKKLVAAATDHGLSERDQHRLLAFAFIPSLEPAVPGAERFLPARPLEMVMQGCHHAVPYMTGFTTHESILLLKYVDLKSPDVADRINRDWEKVVMPELRLPEEYSGAGEVCAKLRDFYLQSQPLGPATLPGFIDMFSDLQFNEQIHLTVTQMVKHERAPVFCYVFSCDGSLNMFKLVNKLDMPGASHMDEFGYLFRGSTFDPDVEPGSAEARVRAQMVKLWTNFARNGVPMDEVTPLLPVKWEAFTATNHCYLNIDKELSLKEDMFQERFAFFEELYRDA